MKVILITLLLVFYAFGKNVLILNSYVQSYPWSAGEIKGVIETIKKSNFKINYYIEDMNTKIFRPTPKREQNILCYLKNKYEKIHFDAIIVIDDNAINFVRKYIDKYTKFPREKRPKPNNFASFSLSSKL